MLKEIPATPKVKLENILYFLNDNIKIIKIYKDSIICTSKIEKVKIPKYLTPKLAYFIGYFQGDGCLGKDKKRITFADEFKEQLYIINNLTFNLFNTKGSIRLGTSSISTKNFYRLEINRNIINLFLNKYWKFFRGAKENIRIPKIMFKNKKILRLYLMGLFDAEGTLPKNANKCKQIFIDIAMKDLLMIKDIRKALKEFGVTTLRPYPRKSISPTTYKINITWELRIRK